MPAGALALVATVSLRTVIPLRDFLQRYLKREHRFSVSTVSGAESWGYFLEFHIPYYAVRSGPTVLDRRKLGSKPLRTYDELPLKSFSSDGETLYFYQAQTSSLCLGPDEWFWTEYFLVDTYFGSERGLHKYFDDCKYGEGFDPPLGGQGKLTNARYDPREYWLMKVNRRMAQATREWFALVDAFDERMKSYRNTIAGLSGDDVDKTHTKTLGCLIAKIQLFAGCIGGTIDAWRELYETKHPYFTTFGKPEWQVFLDRIDQNVVELSRLRRLLLARQDRFESRLRHYVAFPLLFSTALFSVNFIQPAHPIPWFLATLVMTSLLNYMLASHRIPFRRHLRRRLGGSANLSPV
ncbi:hypothetical protein EJ04DRAFT_425947 [Polyplosphaeria fusca]|uniref:Uncharacterized protein n=1 Tax=Polyplosphaeria fusca TaxID=682080 RepID=A0A9P4RAE2_9PLEO|nr:hypothetical protein EJ04DRAFT_425947 [Polyplosphaeria fusca]